MPKFIWKVSFKVEPTLAESEQVGDFLFRVTSNGDTIIERIYEINSYDEVHPERNKASEYAEETLSWLDAEKIRELMLRRMIYQRVFSPILVKIIHPPELLNRDELIKNGFILKRTLYRTVTVSYAILDVGNTLAESENFWLSRFNGFLVKQQNEVMRIANWLERSESECDPIKKFILAWIAFNGLYGLMALLHDKASKDNASKFEFMIKKLFPADYAENIIKNINSEIKSLITYNIMSETGNTNWSRQLSDEMGKTPIDKIEVLKLVTRCVYGVRKQVFHAAPETADILDRVKVAKSALTPVFSYCLKAFITQAYQRDALK